MYDRIPKQIPHRDPFDCVPKENMIIASFCIAVYFEYW